MLKYDRQLLQSHADWLRQKSHLIAIPYGLFFALADAIFRSISHPATFHLFRQPQPVQPNPYEVILWFVCGAIVGVFRGAKYRIQAQQLLCQVEQERHLETIASRLAEKTC